MTACLARNAGAMSGLRADGGTGLDYALSNALAERIDLPLNVVWFDNETGEESDPVLEIYAVLAHGLCDIVPSHPLYQPAIGAPPSPRGPLPRWLGMPEEIDAETQRPVAAHLPHVDLKPIAVTQPYMRAEIGLVYAPDQAEPQNLDDLKDRAVAYQQDTLSGAILIANAPAIAAAARTFNPGPRFLWALETGEADVAIVDVVSYDSHLKHNKISELKLAAWRHPFGMDIGIAVLAENDDLVAVLNRHLADMYQGADIASLAQEEGVTYSPPASHKPIQSISLSTLQRAGE